MNVELESSINRSLNKLLTLELCSEQDIQELREYLSYFAFNLTTYKRPSLSKSEIEIGNFIPDWPDVIEKERVAAWLFQVLPQNWTERLEIEQAVTQTESDKANQFLRLAEAADLIVQTERLVSFSNISLQFFFCTSYLGSQPLKDVIKRATGSNFREMWLFWTRNDEQLTDNILNIIQETDDNKERLSAVWVLAFTCDVRMVEPLLHIIKNNKEDRKFRFKVIDALGKQTELEGVNQIIARLQQLDMAAFLSDVIKNETDKDIRTQIIRTMCLLKAPVYEVLVTTLTEPDPKLKSTVIWGLGLLGDARAIEPLNSLLYDDDPDIRISTIEALKKIGSNECVELIINMLKDENIEVRLFAVHILGEFARKNRYALKNKLLPFLITQLEDQSPFIQLAAAEEIQFLNPKLAGLPMLELLKKETYNDFRKDILDVLIETGTEEAVPYLIDLLINENEDEDIRGISALTLGVIGDKRAIEPLLQTYFKNQNIELQSDIVNALGEIGGEKAFELLVSLLESTQWELRKEAIRSLGNYIHYEPAVTHLIACLKDTDSYIRGNAISALERLGDKSAVDVLIEMLSDEDASVRKYAIDALEVIGDVRALPALEWMVRNDAGYTPRSQIRVVASRAIQEIKKKQQDKSYS